jgi:transmembrane sensor
MEQISRQLLHKYSQGLCSEEESRLVKEWLERDQSLLANDDFDQPVADEEALRSSIWKGITSITQAKPAIVRPIYKLLAAACMVGVLLAGALFFLDRQSPAATHPANDYITYTAPTGHRVQVTLPDSTTVHLMGGSTIRYLPSMRTDPERLMELVEGEAFLDVVHQVSQPFIVKSGDASVRVLGTQFNVRNERADTIMAVTLKQGKIQFSYHNDSPQVLQPGDQLLFHKAKGSVLQQQPVDADLVTSWVNGRLLFRDATVAEVLNRLKVFYGAEFVFKDKPDLEQPLTATFDNLSLSQALSMISFSTTLRFDHHDNIITVTTK